MICNTCGNEIPDGSMFCERCGAPQNAQPSGQPAPQPVQPMIPYGQPAQGPQQGQNPYAWQGQPVPGMQPVQGQPMNTYGQQMPNMNSQNINPYGQQGGYAQPSYPAAKKSSVGFIVFTVIVLIAIAAEVVLFLAPGILTKMNREKKIKEQLGITSSIEITTEADA